MFVKSAIVVLSAILIKVLLIPCYTSTDFEVHRNWMAITHNLPLSKWYYDDVSEWTMDYPPFFAYFEKSLSFIASLVGFEDILHLQEEPLFNIRVVLYQRFTVIGTDLLYMAACAILSYKSSVLFAALPKKVITKARFALFVLLVSNSGLFMVDNIHFQYNSFLSSFLLMSVYLCNEGHFLSGAVLYCSLLNFKHIYLYYGPGFVAFFLIEYFDIKQNICSRLPEALQKGVSLSIVMLLPFAFSFGPFIVGGGMDVIRQIFSRLFPVSRGLTHAYWAPNFWAMYNFADIFLYRLFSVLGYGKYKAPTYNSGLVHEHLHSVLPSISPLVCLLLVLVSLLPILLLLLQKKRADLSLYLALSAYSFFYFGYHVHEKALLLIVLPLIIQSTVDIRFVPITILLGIITSFSLMPLLFTSFEMPIKYFLSTTGFLTGLWCYKHAFCVKFNEVLSSSTILYIIGLIVIEFYNGFIHSKIFGTKLEFLPLMIISVYNAFGVLYGYLELWRISLDDSIFLIYKKKRLEFMEELIKSSAYPVQSIESEEEVQMVGGVDVSTSKANESFAIVTISVYSYPDMEHLVSFSDVAIISEPYVTDYFGMREAQPICDVISKFLSIYPEYRPDVIICDGNGKFHPRGCGIACHIGAGCGIATIGVAKNFTLSPLTAVGASGEIIQKSYDVIESISSEQSGYVPFDILMPVSMNILRVVGSRVPVFVSVGYGIELDLATRIVCRCSRNRVCKPIHMADQLSREKVREIFD